MVAAFISLFTMLFTTPSAGGASIEPSADGTGVFAYVIDSGIRSTHTEFGGRVVPGVSFVDDGLGTADCTGHGSHVAGIIGGAHFGAAKNVTLVPVRVINCAGDGSVQALVAGIDWVAQHHQNPAVVSISLTAGVQIPEIDVAIERLVAADVTVVVAAGNDNKDACTTSPARDAGVLAVASVDPSNTRARDSNWGSCVSLFAPGVGIKSAWNTSDDATAYDSGTSMASPYVAGLAARYLQFHPSSTVADVTENIRATASVSLVKDAGNGSPNLLAASVKER